MKIVDVAEFYANQGGGVKTYLHQKLSAGAAAGHEIVVVAPGPENGVEERHGGRIVWIKGPPMPFDPRYYVLWNEAAVHRALEAERPDVVEGSSPWSGGWFAARWRGDAVKSFIFHQDPVAVYPETFLDQRLSHARINQLARPFWSYLQKLSAHYDLTVTSGEWLAAKLRSFGIREPHAVPFGIDKHRFSPTHADGETRQQMLAACGAPADASLLLTVSRMHPEKRLGVLLDAFEKASKTRNLALVIYGDGPMRNTIRKRARSMQGVHFAGYTSSPDELPRAYASADALLHGSAAETFGLVIAESICSGTPVIVPSVGGAADLAAPGWAETYTPGDVDGCALAIERMLSRDRASLRAACVDAGQTRISTMAEHFAGLFEVYAQQLAKR